jgi:hypothetical protein
MSTEPSTTREHDAREKRFEAGLWGLFFVWLGVSLLAPLSWGVWFLGVGAIVLGAQLARRIAGMNLEFFWLVAGAVFVLGGVAITAPFGIHVGIIPVLCIAAGVGLLARAFAHRPRHG